MILSLLFSVASLLLPSFALADFKNLRAPTALHCGPDRVAHVEYLPSFEKAFTCENSRGGQNEKRVWELKTPDRFNVMIGNVAYEARYGGFLFNADGSLPKACEDLPGVGILLQRKDVSYTLWIMEGKPAILVTTPKPEVPSTEVCREN